VQANEWSRLKEKIMFIYPYWIVVVPRTGERMSPIRSNAATLVDALAQTLLVGDLGRVAQIFLVINNNEFEYDIRTDTLANRSGSYKVHWKDCTHNMVFRDVNEAMKACRELQKKGRDEMKIEFTPDKLSVMESLIEEGKSEQERKGGATDEKPSTFEVIVLDKNGKIPDLIMDLIKEKNNKPDRDSIISLDEITNLSILLNTESDVDAFIKKL